MSKNIIKNDKLQQKLEETTTQLKRALADYHNLERRSQEEKQSLGRFATAIVILKFLPILDNLKKAAEHLKDSGLALVIKQFQEVLGSEGVEEIPAIDQKFDPQIHDAIEVVNGTEDDKVVKVIEIGYLLNNKTLRPAKVAVSKKNLNQEIEGKAEKASGLGDYV